MEKSSGDLEAVFRKFANGAEMDGRTLQKLLKDCKLLDSKLTTTDVDITFAKVKSGPSAKKISFAQFNTALGTFAAKKGLSPDDFKKKVVEAGGPKFAGTKAEYNKFHDDKSILILSKF